MATFTSAQMPINTRRGGARLTLAAEEREESDGGRADSAELGLFTFVCQMMKEARQQSRPGRHLLLTGREGNLAAFFHLPLNRRFIITPK